MQGKTIRSILRSYCHASLQMKNPEEVEKDLWAYYYEGEETIKFICRYERDMSFYDKKLQSFATKYGVDTKNAN